VVPTAQSLAKLTGNRTRHDFAGMAIVRLVTNVWAAIRI